MARGLTRRAGRTAGVARGAGLLRTPAAARETTHRSRRAVTTARRPAADTLRAPRAAPASRRTRRGPGADPFRDGGRTKEL